jgi:hypothetical protein
MIKMRKEMNSKVKNSFNNNNNNSSSSNIVPIVSYINVDMDKFIICKENKGKCGIYR